MKKVPKVLQESAMDCGAACLLSILKYHGGNINYSKLKRMLHVHEKGTSAYDLVQIGEELGFLVEGMKGSVKEILPKSFPCIAHLKKDGYYHFVVVMDYDFKSQKVYIMDPSIGYNNVSLAYWEEICTGNYIFFSVKRFLTCEKNTNFWKILFPKKAFNKTFLSLLFLNQLLSVCEFFGLLETKIFFSYLLTKSDFYNVVHYFLFFLLFTFLTEGGIFLIQWFFLKIQNRMMYQLLKRWYRFLLNLPYYYFEKHEMSEVQTELELLEEIYLYFFHFIRLLFLETPIILFCLIFFYQISHSFLVVTLGMFLLFLVISFISFRYLSRKVNFYLGQKEKRNRLLLDALGKIDMTKGLHQESFFYKKLVDTHFAFQDASYQLSISSESENFLKKFWVKMMRFLFLFFFLKLYFEKKVTIYSYFLLELFFELLMNSFQKVLEFVLVIPRMREEMKKLEGVFTYQKEVFPKKSILPLPQFNQIEVKNFAYKIEEKNVHSDFSCVIGKGEKVLLHGPSGSGKSTLCKMMMKLFPITKGQIYLNQFDLMEISLEDLRNRVCYISQEEGLFNGTLEENITLGKRVFEKDLWKVLELTHVDRILKEKNIPLSFPLSALTMPFSGGERKKILLARTLLLKRDIYLLDEVFESIEKEEAMELVLNVLTYFKDKIVLVISHRLEIDAFFNQVLTLEVEK